MRMSKPARLTSFLVVGAMLVLVTSVFLYYPSQRRALALEGRALSLTEMTAINGDATCTLCNKQNTFNCAQGFVVVGNPTRCERCTQPKAMDRCCPYGKDTHCYYGYTFACTGTIEYGTVHTTSDCGTCTTSPWKKYSAPCGLTEVDTDTSGLCP